MTKNADEGTEESEKEVPAEYKESISIRGKVPRKLQVCCCLPAFILTWCGMKDPKSQQAYREKIALCFVLFLTASCFGQLFKPSNTICLQQNATISFRQFSAALDVPHQFAIRGAVYDMSSVLDLHSSLEYFKNHTKRLAMVNSASAIDATAFFPIGLTPYCESILPTETCTDDSNFPHIIACHTGQERNYLEPLLLARISFSWKDILQSSWPYVVFNNRVLDLAQLNNSTPNNLPADVSKILQIYNGQDVTKRLLMLNNGQKIGQCLVAMFDVGQIENDSFGCITYKIVLQIAILTIVLVIFVKFGLASYYEYQFSNIVEVNKQELPIKSVKDNSGVDCSKSNFGQKLYTILFLKCSSQTEDQIHDTMSSIAMSNYNQKFTILCIIADGIPAADEDLGDLTAPEIFLSLLEIDDEWKFTQPMAYLALGEALKKLNYANVYAAWYKHGKQAAIPTLLLVKTGNEFEATDDNPGKRGDRDSQIILLQFLQHVTFNQPMSPLEYDMFTKMTFLMGGVTPENFEIVITIKLGVKIDPDAIGRTVAAFKSDNLIIGACGETLISNCAENYVIIF